MKFKEWFLSKFSSTYRQFLADIEECIKKNTDTFQMNYYSWNYMLLDKLYDLSHLKTLSLHPSLNSVRKKMPKKLANLVNLEVLYVYEFLDLTAISSLKNLKKLLVFSMYLRDIEPISELKNLERLHIVTGPFIRNYKVVSNLSNLREFVFQGTLPVGLNLQFIKDMPNLKKFSLFLRNNMKGFYQLSRLTNVEEIDISGNEIIDITFLKPLKKLKKINLSSNRIKDISQLTFLEGVEEINLSHNQIEMIPHGLFQNLKNLKKLNLQNNPIRKVDENILNNENCLPNLKKIMNNNT